MVNADQIPVVFAHLGPEATAGRYNVGYCMWEQEELPDAYRAGLPRYLHEIWTATAFTADAFGRKAPIPVRRVPYPVAPLEKKEGLDIRARLGLPADAFLFVYLFNYLSYFERKNPLGAVRAFREAFGDDPRQAAADQDLAEGLRPRGPPASSSRRGRRRGQRPALQRLPLARRGQRLDARVRRLPLAAPLRKDSA